MYININKVMGTIIPGTAEVVVTCLTSFLKTDKNSNKPKSTFLLLNISNIYLNIHIPKFFILR